MNAKDIPILVPARGKSIRCPNKNSKLLYYMVKWLRNEGLQATVLSDDPKMRYAAYSFGLDTWEEHRTDKDDNLTACRKFMKDRDEEFYFELPLTQPFKHHGLLQDMLNAMDDNTDFVVTSHTVTDRSLFYVKDNKFITESKERKGCMCPEYEMVDGTVYLVRKSFIEKVNSNEDFWDGKFKTVINHAPFIDIDTVEDMEKFKFICDYDRILY